MKPPASGFAKRPAGRGDDTSPAFNHFMNRFFAPLLAAALYLVLAGALIGVVPFNGAPDEGAHAQYVAAIVSTHALPVFAGQAPPNAGYEFHQPPLFYLLAAPLWALAGSGAQVVAVRALSLLFGLLTLGVVWQGALLLFGEKSRAPAVCVLLAALSPVHQGVGASINNDALAGLWTACLFYLVARAWLVGATQRVVLALGVVAGLGALTKLTAFPLGVWALVCVALALRAQGNKPLTALLPAVGIALLIALPMWVRNQILYGDPLAYGMFSRAATKGTPGFLEFSIVMGMSFMAYARGILWQIIGTAWGFAGGPNSWSHLTRPTNPHLPGPLWSVPFLIVVLVPLLALWNVGRAAQNAFTRSQPSARRTLAWCWAMGVGLLVLAWMSFALDHFSGSQARYLHGVFLPITLLLGGGLSRSRVGLIGAGVLGALMLGMTLANIFVWKTLV